MKQVELSKGNVRRVCWVDDGNDVKGGQWIRLVHEDEFYKVDKVYDRQVDKQDIRRSWNVGGL